MNKTVIIILVIAIVIIGGFFAYQKFGKKPTQTAAEKAAADAAADLTEVDAATYIDTLAAS